MPSEAEDRPAGGGFLPIYRKLKDSDIWNRDDFQLKLWIYILMNARWKAEPYVKDGIRVERGQFLRSYSRIAEDLKLRKGRGWQSRKEGDVRYHLKVIEKDGSIRMQGNALGVLITVVNYDTYNPLGGANIRESLFEQGCNLRGKAYTIQKERESKKGSTETTEPKTAAKAAFALDADDPIADKQERQVQAVVDAWLKARPKARISGASTKATAMRLRNGYTVDRLVAVIEFWEKDEKFQWGGKDVNLTDFVSGITRLNRISGMIDDGEAPRTGSDSNGHGEWEGDPNDRPFDFVAYKAEQAKLEKQGKG